MQDWNRDGRTDAADIATEYAAYNAIMNSKPRRSTRQTSGNGAGAAWAIVAAAVLALLTLCSR